jgi:ATP-dependent DNA ligase
MTPWCPFSPVLLSELKNPFHRDGWVYEEKYDGFRVLAVKDGGQRPR